MPPLKTSENLMLFPFFQVVGKSCIGKRWVNVKALYCIFFHILETFNRYVTLKGGRGGGGNPFCYGALLEGEGGSSDTIT